MPENSLSFKKADDESMKLKYLPNFSGKEKAHKHKQIFPSDCPGRGRGLPTGWGGVSNRPVALGVKSLCAWEPVRITQDNFNKSVFEIRVPVPGGIRVPEPKEAIGDRGDREIVYVPNVYVHFLAPNFGGIQSCFCDTPCRPRSL